MAQNPLSLLRVTLVRLALPLIEALVYAAVPAVADKVCRQHS